MEADTGEAGKKLKPKIRHYIKLSSDRLNGVNIKEPKIQQAFRYFNYMDIGMDISPEDVPDIVCLDLIEVIQGEKGRFQKKQMKELERKSKRPR